MTTRLTELRLDFEAADQGRLQLGLVVTVATVAVVASGWPPGHPVQRGLFFVLGALPALAIGTGLVVSGIIEAHSQRRGEREADDREVEVLRARIAAEAISRSDSVVDWAADAGDGPVTRRMPRPVSARNRKIRLRSGHLGLR